MNELVQRRPIAFALVILVLWLAALASAAGAIWLRHRARELFVELERANARRDNLEIEWGRLQLEQSAWSTHAFVERVAAARLRMGMPPAPDIQIVAQPLAAAAPTAVP